MEKIENLIRSFEELAEVYDKISGKKSGYPYFYIIKSSGKVLYSLGAHHTHDPKNYQIKIIKKQWRRFLQETKKKKRIVLVEGGGAPSVKSEKIAIEKYNGGGLPVYLAEKEGVEWYSPEPNWKYETDELLKEFTKEEIIYYDFARLTAQWNRLTKKPNYEKYIKRYLDRSRRQLQWKDFEFTVKNLINIHNKNHNHKFNETNESCFIEDSSPYTSKVCRSSGKIRDTHIVQKILDYWKEDRNIFFLYGSSHAITIEPALKKQLK